MANWTLANPTRDQALADDYNYGSWRVCFALNETASTADLGIASSGGGITMHRYTNAVTVPAVTAPVTGYCVTQMDIIGVTNANGIVGGLEFALGTLTVSGNSFSNGASMPTRTVLGTSTQLGTLMAMAVVTTALTATTPILTFTYTNQSGVTNQSGAITLPTNAAANSAFFLNFKLAAGDTGIRAITNLSINSGSAGVITIYGLMPIAYGGSGSTASNSGMLMEPLSSPLPMIKCVPNDIISLYGLSTGNLQGIVNIIATPEV